MIKDDIEKAKCVGKSQKRKSQTMAYSHGRATLSSGDIAPASS